MRWFLLRQEADGSRIDVADFESQEAAHEAMASYEYHYPQYAPYLVEARGAVPDIQAAPLTPESGSKSNAAALVVLAAVVLAGLLAVVLIFFTRSDSPDIASAAQPTPIEIERDTSGIEPTAPPVITPPGQAQPDDAAPPRRPTPPPATPPPPPPVPPTPEPEQEEVRLTQATSTLDSILDRDELNCGVSGNAVAFSVVQGDGSVVGFDADMCRAVAAAILGDSEAVNFVVLNAAERFTALQVGEVDLLMRNSTWTQSRDTDVGADFGPTTYYDGQQLMGRAVDGFTADSQIVDLDGAVVCTIAGTTTELNIIAAAEDVGISIELLTFEDFSIVTQTFIDGACDLITIDGSNLVARKAEQQPSDQDWVIFPRIPLSKEPLGPIYGPDDSRFADVVNWTIYAMLTADESGINQSNVFDALADPADASADRLLGGPGELQTLMGLEPDAFFQVIAQVGSYRDVFNRHLGPAGITLDGSLNDLWTNGGLMYPPPAR